MVVRELSEVADGDGDDIESRDLLKVHLGFWSNRDIM